MVSVYGKCARQLSMASQYCEGDNWLWQVSMASDKWVFLSFHANEFSVSTLCVCVGADVLVSVT